MVVPPCALAALARIEGRVRRASFAQIFLGFLQSRLRQRPPAAILGDSRLLARTVSGLYLGVMTQIIPVNYRSDILPEYQDTPAGQLLEYHNLERALGSAAKPELLIGMCMDARKALRMPQDFAFVLRTAGANMRDNEFRMSYAIAIAGVKTIVLIAHTDCGMRR